MSRQSLNELSVVGKGKMLSNTYNDSMTEKELLLFRILQCVPGVSSTKALSVLQHYKSVAELVNAYASLQTKEMKEDLLSVGSL